MSKKVVIILFAVAMNLVTVKLFLMSNFSMFGNTVFISRDTGAIHSSVVRNITFNMLEKRIVSRNTFYSSSKEARSSTHRFIYQNNMNLDYILKNENNEQYPSSSKYRFYKVSDFCYMVGITPRNYLEHKFFFVCSNR